MIIVSQDGITLFPFNRAIYVANKFVFGDAEDDDYFLLGKYSTRERAKQELQNIMDAYHHRLDVYEMKEE